MLSRSLGRRLAPSAPPQAIKVMNEARAAPSAHLMARTAASASCPCFGGWGGEAFLVKRGLRVSGAPGVCSTCMGIKACESLGVPVCCQHEILCARLGVRGDPRASIPVCNCVSLSFDTQY